MTNDFLDRVKTKIMSSDRESMTEEERAVMALLWKNIGEVPVTQRQIAKSERWMGCHPKHEADIMRGKLDTTTRQVRQIIRDLRVNHGIPILSSVKGYWIPTSEEEALTYISTLEREVKAQIASWHETYKAMKTSLNSTSSILEQLPLL